MGYSIKAGEALSSAAPRIALELLDESLSRLDAWDETSEAAQFEEDVHEVRKNCKKLRGLARLSRPSLGKAYGRANAAFRDAARELSPIRDAHALLETFDAFVLAHGDHAPELGSVREGLAARAASASAHASSGSKRLKRARSLLQDARRGVGKWSIVDDPDVLDRGVRKTFSRGRDAMELAAQKGGDEALHEWRKRAKYTWYHLRLVEDAAPSVLSNLEGLFHDLTDALGDDHDLAVLGAQLRDAPDTYGGEAAIAAARGAFEPIREGLQRRAFRLGARLYVEKPGAFSRRIAGYWKVWQSVGPELPAREVAALSSPRDALQDKTASELYALAQEFEVAGRSRMRRDELEAAVRAAGGAR